KLKSKGAPPSGESPELVSHKSKYAYALFPLVIVNSAPAAPFLSCQPKGEAIALSGLFTTVSGLSFGFLKGMGNSLYWEPPKISVTDSSLFSNKILSPFVALWLWFVAKSGKLH